MSLMRTLAKVAVGVAIAKGAGAMMKNSGGAQSQNAGLGGLLGGLTGGGAAGGGLQGMLGSLTGGGASAAGGAGGLQDMLGGLLGGAQGGGASGGLAGGLGGLLENLGGGSAGGAGGGLQGMLGGLAGAAGAGGLLASLGGAAASRPAQNNASFGQVLNSAFAQTPEPEIEPTADQEVAAGLMLRAMIQAAKSDGNLDDAERKKLLGQLGEEVDGEEAAFVQAEMQAPVDVAGLASQVPTGMEPQIYAVSLMAINLDSQAEAQYLDQLGKALNLAPQAMNNIHTQLGVQTLYT